MNPRRAAFWLLFVILLYTLVGFVLAPWAIQRFMIPSLADRLGREIRLDELRINPYALTLEAKGLRFGDAGGADLIGFDRLFVNLQLSSVFQRAWSFRRISLERPSLVLLRDDTGETNIGRLLSDLSPPAAEPVPAEAESQMIRLLIAELTITGGVIELTDRVPEPEVRFQFKPIDITFNHLSTLPSGAGRQEVVIAAGPDGKLSWSGSLQLNPLLAEGHLSAGGPYLPILYRYIENLVDFEVARGRVEVALDYRIEERADGKFALRIDELDFGLRRLSIRTSTPELEVLSLPEFWLRGGRFEWPEQRIQFATFEVEGARLRVVQDDEGVLNLSRLLLPESQPEPEPEPSTDPVADPLAGWSLHLGKLEISDFNLEFEDQTLAAAAAAISLDIDLGVRDIGNLSGARFPFELSVGVDSQGTISLEGELGLLPELVLDSSLRVKALALGLAQPWLSEVARVEIEGGLLNLDTRLVINPDEPLSVRGELSIDSLQLSDAVKRERLISWNQLLIRQLVASVANQSLEISEVVLDAPFIRLLIAEDHTTNFSTLAVDSKAAGGEASAPPAFALSRFILRSGSAEISDRSLPLPFTAQFSKLEGEISAIASDSAKPTMIELEGQLGQYGLSTVSGQLVLNDPTQHTDIAVTFRNLEISDYSPYTVKFTGRGIAAGKLDITLDYQIESGRMHGENKLVMRDLRLGDKVDHPDATNLPLALAVALLKRPDGSIDIDLPVEGDVDDPEFSYGGVLFRAFTNLVTKIASSPFRLLAGLIGEDAEGLGQVAFRPGRSDLAPPELQTLSKLAEALALRPGIGLRLTGVMDVEADRHAIALARVEARIAAAREGGGDAEVENASTEVIKEEVSSKRLRKRLETFAREGLPELDLSALRAASTRPKDPAAPEGGQVLDEALYLGGLMANLIEAEPVLEHELRELALSRANAIRAVIAGDADIGQDRVVVVAEPIAVTIGAEGWIAMKLELDVREIVGDRP